MNSYKAPIGRSSYNIPYNEQEDLLLLRKICSEANKIVNSILASNSDITNEFALTLALINMIYENQSSLNHAGNSSNLSQQLTENHDSNTYTSEDVLSIIDHLKKKILEIENVG